MLVILYFKQNESQLDENGLAAQMLPLATTFCRVCYAY